MKQKKVGLVIPILIVTLVVGYMIAFPSESFANSPPDAEDFDVVTLEDETVTFEMLDHVSDADGDSFTVEFTQTSHGTLTINGTQVTYTPDLNWNGTEPLTYQAYDGISYSNVANVNIFVLAVNEPPVLTLEPSDVTVDEGDTALNSGSVSDPEGDDVTLSASVGTVVGNGDGSWDWSYDTLDGPDNSQTVTITADDEYEGGGINAGSITEDTFDLVVNNVAPIITTFNTPPVVSNNPFSISGDFTDPGILDTHSAKWDWGDGSPSESGTVNESNGSGTVTGSHTYSSPGYYEVTLEVQDDDGDQGAGTTSITVHEEVSVDILPGKEDNTIKCDKLDKLISVVILSTEDFDATNVDHTTVTFEGASELHVDSKTGELRRHEEDVDEDGDTDLVFHFRFGDTGLTCDDTEAVLTGETFDGRPIGGVNAVTMIEKNP